MNAAATSMAAEGANAATTSNSLLNVEDRFSIEVEHVVALGNVDQALASFFDDAVTQASTNTGVSEREIRAWVDDELISEQGFRTQALRGPGRDGATVLRSLEDAHVIRTDSRRGAQWYELAHDRLVAPVRESNSTWRATHLSALQLDAMTWDRQGRPDELLATAPGLSAAEVWATAHADEMLTTDTEFLAASLEYERAKLLVRRASRRTRVLAGVAGGLAILALFGGSIAYSKVQTSDRLRNALGEAEAARAELEQASAQLVLANDEATTARDQALAAQAIAESQTKEANTQRNLAELAVKEAEAQTAEADKQRALAEAAGLNAQTQLVEAERQRALAEAAGLDAVKQRALAEAATQMANDERSQAVENSRKCKEAYQSALAAFNSGLESQFAGYIQAPSQSGTEQVIKNIRGVVEALNQEFQGTVGRACTVLATNG